MIGRKEQKQIRNKLLRKYYVLNKEIFVPHKEVRFWGNNYVTVKCKYSDDAEIAALLITELLQEQLQKFIALSTNPFSPTPSFGKYTLVFKKIERSNRYVRCTFQLVKTFTSFRLKTSTL